MMEVGVTTLRSELKRWLERAASGEEIVITDHGIPVARLVGVETTPILELLDQDGVIRLPRRRRRPAATGRRRAPTSESIADLVSEQRR